MMSLFETLTDREGVTHPGPACSRPHPHAGPPGGPGHPGGRAAGRAPHRPHLPLFEERDARGTLARATTPAGREGEAIYRLGRLTASYVHFYFPSNPAAVAALFGA
jgi:cobyrinic acid a,c-diamide synthase